MPSSHPAKQLGNIEFEDEEPQFLALAEIKRRFAHHEIVRTQSTRTDLRRIRENLAVPPEEREQAISDALSFDNLSDDEKFQLSLAITKEFADELLREEKYEDAIHGYENALGIITFDHETGLRPREFYNIRYLVVLQPRPGFHRMKMFLDLVSCCNGMSQAYINLNRKPEAMDWLQEIEIIYECLKYGTVGIYSHLMRLPYLEVVTYRMEAAVRYVHLFCDLGNTAAAGYFAYRVILYQSWFYGGVPEIDSIIEQSGINGIPLYRHPDPETMGECSVQYPELQLRGIWTKIEASLKIRPPKLPNPNAWIWRSRLYVRYGDYLFNQLWYLNLKNPTSWKRLRPFPLHLFALQPSLAKPIVFKNHVWFFSGHEEILRFNLVKESWDRVVTKYQKKWPFNVDKFERDNLCFYSVERFRNKMCVFGGSTTERESIFMLLDLEKLTWRRLDVAPKLANGDWSSQDLPMGRGNGSTWVVEDEDKFFIMYGHFSEKGSNRLFGEIFENFWSYSFKSETWTRERLWGNFPSPRVAMATAYHKALKQVVAFGGESDKIVFNLTDKDEKYNNLHCADTFIMDIESMNWKQVITRNFPAWRAGSRMLIDEADGRIYIYGGYCNMPDLYDTDETIFGDIWRLDLDLAGHNDYFDEQAFQKFTPFKAGPYRSCFACKKFGFDYFRCEGVCGGKVIYCSKRCQRAAWKTHKTVDGCRKQE